MMRPLSMLIFSIERRHCDRCTRDLDLLFSRSNMTNDNILETMRASCIIATCCRIRSVLNIQFDKLTKNTVYHPKSKCLLNINFDGSIIPNNEKFSFSEYHFNFVSTVTAGAGKVLMHSVRRTETPTVFLFTYRLLLYVCLIL